MKHLFISLFLISAFALNISADTFSDARKAYDAKDYAKAAPLFEAAVREKNDAKSNYGLGLTYLRLNRFSDAIQPLEAAQRLDPSLAFAPNRKFFEDRLAQARKGGNAKSAPPSTNSRAAIEQTISAFANGALVADVSNTLTAADKDELQKVVAEARGKKFSLRVAFLDASPSDTQSFVTRDARRLLNLGDNDIIVAANRTGVYAAGQQGNSELDREEINLAAKAAAPFFRRQEAGRTGYGMGLVAFSRQLVSEATSDRSTRRGSYGFLGFLGLGAAGAGLAFVIGRRKLRQKAYQKKLDDGINLLMNEINDKLGKEFNVNARFVNWQKEYEEIKAKETWKDHTKIDRLNATLNDAVRQPERYFDYQPGIKEIKEAAAKLGAPPPPEKSSDDVFDYFDGRPLNKDEAVVVALKDKDGQEIRVLTSQAHADEMGQGQTPKVLTREVNGQRVHWSNDPSFDPRRDYHPYDPYQRNTSWVDIWMMSQIFSPHTFYGPSIYPYYNQNYYYSQPYYSQPIQDMHGYSDYGSDSIGFGEERHSRPHDSHQNYAPQESYDNNSGGMDFGFGGGGNSSDNSWNSSDSGGGSDWSSSDNSSDSSSDWGGGGSDWGSSDSSSDSGGGDWGSDS